MFNALKYTEELRKAGFTREQSEVSLRLIIDIMNENFATKSDLKELELRMESGFRELEYKLTIKLGSIVTIAVGVAVTLVKLLTSAGH